MLVLVLSLIQLSVTAQQYYVEWEKNLGGSASEGGHQIIETFDGDFLMVTTTGSEDQDVSDTLKGPFDFSDVWVVRLDSAGTILWDTLYGGSGAEFSPRVLQRPDSSFVIVATSSSDDYEVPGNHGGGDIWIFNIDQSGSILWNHHYGGSGAESSSNIKATPDSGFVIVGRTFSDDFDLSGNYGFVDGWVLKLDQQGNLEWEQHYGGTGGDVFNDVTLSSDGGYYVIGESFSSDVDVSTNNGAYDTWVLKLDSIGNLEWEHSYGGLDGESGLGIAASGNTLYVAGTTESDSIGGLPASAGLNDFWLVKTDTTDSVHYSYTYGGSSSDYLWAPTTFVRRASGNFVFGGASFSTDGDVYANFGHTDYWIFETDSLGNLLWEMNLGGSEAEFIQSLIITSDSGLLLSGQSQSSDSLVSGNYGFADAWVVKLALCDSVVGAYTDSICAGDSILLGGVWRTSAGTYLDTVQSIGACDVIDQVTLVVLSPSASTIAETACDVYLSPSGNMFASSGTYSDTLVNAVGCDSVITINLTVNQSEAQTITPIVCGSYTSPAGNIWTTTGMYADTFTNTVGCDSILLIDLVVNPIPIDSIAPIVCDSFISPSGTYTWTTSGQYTDTLATVLGCDSILVIDLIVNSSNGTAITVDACDSYTSPSGFFTWTTSGQYFDSFTNVAGCDSVVTINLTINQSSIQTIVVLACESYTAPSGSPTWTTSGQYVDFLVDQFGCDSVVIVDLTINDATTGTTSAVACESYTSPSGNNVWTVSGQYIDTLIGFKGCDSLLTIDLTINEVTSASIAAQTCDTYTSPSGNYIWDVTGLYQDTITNILGCDSVLFIDLEVIEIDTMVTTFGATLMAAEDSANYQWLQCDSLLQVISGATEKTFVPAQNGVYAVAIDQAGCLDTSMCISVMNVGLPMREPQADIRVFPNPARSVINIEFAQKLNGQVSLRIRGMLGSMVQVPIARSGNQQFVLDIASLARGTYFVEVKTAEGIQFVRFVKS